jgi:hypothetical protein
MSESERSHPWSMGECLQLLSRRLGCTMTERTAVAVDGIYISLFDTLSCPTPEMNCSYILWRLRTGGRQFIAQYPILVMLCEGEIEVVETSTNKRLLQTSYAPDAVESLVQWLLLHQRMRAQTNDNLREILYRLQRITRWVYAGLAVLLVLVGLVGWRLLAS